MIEKQRYKHLILGGTVSGLVRTNNPLNKYLVFATCIPSISLGALPTVVSKTKALCVSMALRGQTDDRHCENTLQGKT